MEDKAKNPEMLSEEDEKETSPKKQNDAIEPINLISPSLPNPSITVWGNKRSRKKIDAYTEVVKSANNLLDAMGSHSKLTGRLRDIDIELETEHLKRKTDLEEAKNNNELLEKKKKLAHLDIDLLIAEKEEKLKRYSDKKSPAETQEEEKLNKIRKEELFKAKEKAIRALSLFTSRKEIEKEFQKRQEEIIRGRQMDELTKEEKEFLEDLEDAKNHAIDNL